MPGTLLLSPDLRGRQKRSPRRVTSAPVVQPRALARFMADAISERTACSCPARELRKRASRGLAASRMEPSLSRARRTAPLRPEKTVICTAASPHRGQRSRRARKCSRNSSRVSATAARCTSSGPSRRTGGGCSSSSMASPRSISGAQMSCSASGRISSHRERKKAMGASAEKGWRDRTSSAARRFRQWAASCARTRDHSSSWAVRSPTTAACCRRASSSFSRSVIMRIGELSPRNLSCSGSSPALPSSSSLLP
jgi:hypothetical protein